ncbi:hypothetical protein BAUCODRAFT_84912 [Baudoinia panamericana UAMH 10762]|uniref:Methyltransferase domain-containing protein n=1 Tax=Baudoinia panamericana (strain UAMH 10762) TaxID=717646 RepID=M2NHX7_BAUPA|nr:uncharacterized protein BAUCODRAFT_84912 [Baudoinia panamericana UAMH 10762]EMC98959.1 hypothetical protein BAUCODRAFT_84912 [Baudoinia panamericana UAMH 10762]
MREDSVMAATGAAPISSLLNVMSEQSQPSTSRAAQPTILHQQRIARNGRMYYSQWYRTYPFPCDDTEQHRLDVMHRAWFEAMGQRLHLATLRDSPMRILDVGYGTGIWALDMAETYPNAEIVAIDIGEDHPVLRGFDNVDFRPNVDFTTNDWGVETASFDFIHCAMLCGSVPDWRRFVERISSLLKPGGQAEFVELDWTPRCDEQSLPPGSPVSRWWQAMQDASIVNTKPITYPDDLEAFLEEARCPASSHHTIEVNTSENYREYHEDEQRNVVARWFKLFMFDTNFQSFTGMSMGLLTTHLGWAPEEVVALCENVRDILKDTYSPVYYKLHVVTARKRGGRVSSL